MEELRGAHARIHRNETGNLTDAQRVDKNFSQNRRERLWVRACLSVYPYLQDFLRLYSI